MAQSRSASILPGRSGYRASDALDALGTDPSLQTWALNPPILPAAPSPSWRRSTHRSWGVGVALAERGSHSTDPFPLFRTVWVEKDPKERLVPTPVSKHGENESLRVFFSVLHYGFI